MEYRLVGQTGLSVSALSFGAMSFGGAGGFAAVANHGVDEARALVDQCLDAGVNLFDTADVYSAGASEELLGRALGARRSRVLVATKLHARMSDDVNDVGLSRHHIVRACEASLRRLGTDWIDLYQVHSYDGLTAVDETLRALDDLVRAGKVRYVGCSNLSGWHLMKSLATSERLGLSRYAVLQAYYSLVGRDVEHELVPLCLDQRVAMLVWSPLAFGFLGGRWRRGEAVPADARMAAWGTPGEIDAQSWTVLDEVRAIAAAHDRSPAQVALAWLLGRPGVTSVIVGARTAHQLADNLAAASFTLAAADRARLDAVSARPLPYPYWHQKKFNAERLRE